MSRTGSESSAGWGARFPIVAFLVTLCVVAGVKLVRSGRSSLMLDGVNLSVDWNDPFWELFSFVAAFVIPANSTKICRGFTSYTVGGGKHGGGHPLPELQLTHPDNANTVHVCADMSEDALDYVEALVRREISRV